MIGGIKYTVKDDSGDWHLDVSIPELISWSYTHWTISRQDLQIMLRKALRASRSNFKTLKRQIDGELQERALCPSEDVLEAGCEKGAKTCIAGSLDPFILSGKAKIKVCGNCVLNRQQAPQASASPSELSGTEREQQLLQRRQRRHEQEEQHTRNPTGEGDQQPLQAKLW
jgi:hypothetical protein